LEGESNLVRVVVDKKIGVDRDPGNPFTAISSSHPTDTGFVVLADYPTRTVFEGPAPFVQTLLSGLRFEGFEARVATELDELRFNGHRIDPDTGAATPSFSPTRFQPSRPRGVFILVLRSYPASAWFTELTARGIRLVEAVSPSSYIALLDRTAAASLSKDTRFVRGCFTITPEMKTAPSATGFSESVYHQVLLKAVEEEPVDSIRPFLDAYSERPVFEDRLPNGRVTYLAWLSDIEIATVSLFENVYLIADVGDAAPSSERQGMLVLRPNVVSGRLELPEPLTQNVNDYYYLLTHTSTPLAQLTNTRVGIIDTGFDTGCTPPLSTCTASHADFPSGVQIETEFPGDTADSATGHGTFTASLIGGFMDFNVRADTDQYRLGLGIAPNVAIVSDKFFRCPPPNMLGSGDIQNAIQRLKLRQVNVINMSFNQCGAGTCGYSGMSEIVDWSTRKGSLLFTISAGNQPECVGCPVVRAPATAKNAIAVGATESFTPSSWINDINRPPLTCDWDQPPFIRDGRNIPSFSAQRDPDSMVKPDLVAPGVRISGPRTQAALCGTGIFCNPDTQPPLAGYGMSAGTSFSAAAVAGAAAVVRRWFQNLTTVANPSPAMVKAILINGARDVGSPPATPQMGLCPTFEGLRRAAVHREDSSDDRCIGHIPDPYQGWGMLSFERLLGPANNYYFSDFDWHPELGSAMPVPGGNLGAEAPYRVKNDLSLGACRYPACNPRWYGNNFDPVSGNSLANAATNDAVNNVEQIIIPTGTYASGTQFTVWVQANNVTEHIFGFPCYEPPGPCVQPVQDFALFAENAR
jgi:subtilisin family serine protease